MYNFTAGKKTISLTLKAEQKNYLQGLALAARFLGVPYDITPTSGSETKTAGASPRASPSAPPSSPLRGDGTRTTSAATAAASTEKKSFSFQSAVSGDFPDILEIPADDLGYSKGTRFTLVSESKQRTYLTLDPQIWQGSIEFATQFLKRHPLSFVTDIIDFGKNSTQILPDIVSDASVKVNDADTDGTSAIPAVYLLRYSKKAQLAQIFLGERSIVSAPYAQLQSARDFLDPEREIMTEQFTNFLTKALLTRMIELPEALTTSSDDAGITLSVPTQDGGSAPRKRITNEALNDNMFAPYIQQLLAGYTDEL